MVQPNLPEVEQSDWTENQGVSFNPRYPLFFESTGRKEKMARKIQRAWKKIVSNPKYAICRRRLQRECEHDITPPRKYSYPQDDSYRYYKFRQISKWPFKSIFSHFPEHLKPPEDFLHTQNVQYLRPYDRGNSMWCNGNAGDINISIEKYHEFPKNLPWMCGMQDLELFSNCKGLIYMPGFDSTCSLSHYLPRS